MWAPHATPKPIEKAKPSKPKRWTEAQTQGTQAIVDNLAKVADALILLGPEEGSSAVRHIKAACIRFALMDHGVKVPESLRYV